VLRGRRGGFRIAFPYSYGVSNRRRTSSLDRKRLMRSLRLTARAGILGLLAACATDAPTGPVTTPPLQAIIAATALDHIVVLHDSVANVTTTARHLAELSAATVKVEWQHVIKGFLVEISPAAAERLGRRPEVRLVERDGPITIVGTQAPAGAWGLDRIDQRPLPLNNSFTYPGTAAGVHAYILDTGINPTHAEFTGRLGTGFSVFGGLPIDCNGHGTHVAGTVGGTTYGVAKGVRLHAVRVLDCSGGGRWSGYITGADWVSRNRILPAVANASIGGAYSAAADLATINLAQSGVVTSVASGNSSLDACQVSPARAGWRHGVMSVNASTSGDARAIFSDFGRCTDIYAPGAGIKSAWIGTGTATRTISGTSMAAPHVAGAAALYLQVHPTASPAQVEVALASQATPNVITGNPSGTPNLLLYVGAIAGSPPPGPPPPQPPVPPLPPRPPQGPGNRGPNASFTYVCVPNGPNASAGVCTLTSTSKDREDDRAGRIMWHEWHSDPYAPPHPDINGPTVITRLYDGNRGWWEVLKVTDSGGKWSTKTRWVQP
ncbi:MAG: S8 family serine peptidase, partial [Gemmatimonadaceae bacterium]